MFGRTLRMPNAVPSLEFKVEIEVQPSSHPPPPRFPQRTSNCEWMELCGIGPCYGTPISCCDASNTMNPLPPESPTASKRTVPVSVSLSGRRPIVRMHGTFVGSTLPIHTQSLVHCSHDLPLCVVEFHRSTAHHHDVYPKHSGSFDRDE